MRVAPAFMLGIQALVRLLIEQARLDRDAGINSRGLVSGYPGSPLEGIGFGTISQSQIA